MILRRSCSCLVTLLALLTFTSCSSNSKPAENAASSAASSPAASATPAGGASSAVSSATSSNPSEIDACKLVTKAEAEAAIGEKLKDPDSGPASTAGGTICMYGSPDSMSAKNVTIRVESPNYNWEKNKEAKRIEGEQMWPQRGYLRQVPGLGKDAYFARHVLHVLTDKGILTVIIFKDPGDAVAREDKETKEEAAEKSLAEKAVTRM